MRNTGERSEPHHFKYNDAVRPLSASYEITENLADATFDKSG